MSGVGEGIVLRLSLQTYDHRKILHRLKLVQDDMLRRAGLRRHKCSTWNIILLAQFPMFHVEH